MSNNDKSILLEVFRVKKRDNLIVGVPRRAPQIIDLFSSRSKLKISKGLPKDYANLMTDFQKEQFKKKRGK